MIECIKGLPLQNVETCFLSQNNQNRQQNKLINMVDGNLIIGHIYI